MKHRYATFLCAGITLFGGAAMAGDAERSPPVTYDWDCKGSRHADLYCKPSDSEKATLIGKFNSKDECNKQKPHSSLTAPCS
jgi:hypothetical protein